MPSENSQARCVELNAQIKIASAVIFDHEPDTTDELVAQMREGVLGLLKAQDRQLGSKVAPQATTLVEYLRVHRAKRLKASMPPDEVEMARKLAKAERSRMDRNRRQAAYQERRKLRRQEERIKRETLRAEAERAATLAGVVNPMVLAEQERAAMKRAERAAMQQERREVKSAINDKAAELFLIVCEFAQVEPERVAGDGCTPLLIHVRQLFICMARDSGYCGGSPSYPALAKIVNKAHTAAMSARENGKDSPEVKMCLRALCERYGVALPVYAAAQEAAA